MGVAIWTVIIIVKGGMSIWPVAVDGWLEGQSKESVARHVRQDSLKILHQIIHTENSPIAPRPPTILKDQASDLLRRL